MRRSTRNVDSLTPIDVVDRIPSKGGGDGHREMASLADAAGERLARGPPSLRRTSCFIPGPGHAIIASMPRKKLPQAKIGMVSLGCPKNLVDTEMLLGTVAQEHVICSDPRDADIVIVNTCAFI